MAALFAISFLISLVPQSWRAVRFGLVKTQKFIYNRARYRAKYVVLVVDDVNPDEGVCYDGLLQGSYR
jgi:hypothetical protein